VETARRTADPGYAADGAAGAAVRDVAPWRRRGGPRTPATPRTGRSAG